MDGHDQTPRVMPMDALYRKSPTTGLYRRRDDEVSSLDLNVISVAAEESGQAAEPFVDRGSGDGGRNRGCLAEKPIHRSREIKLNAIKETEHDPDVIEEIRSSTRDSKGSDTVRQSMVNWLRGEGLEKYYRDTPNPTIRVDPASPTTGLDDTPPKQHHYSTPNLNSATLAPGRRPTTLNPTTESRATLAPRLATLAPIHAPRATQNESPDPIPRSASSIDWADSRVTTTFSTPISKIADDVGYTIANPDRPTAFELRLIAARKLRAERAEVEGRNPALKAKREKKREQDLKTIQRAEEWYKITGPGPAFRARMESMEGDERDDVEDVNYPQHESLRSVVTHSDTRDDEDEEVNSVHDICAVNIAPGVTRICRRYALPPTIPAKNPTRIDTAGSGREITVSDDPRTFGAREFRIRGGNSHRRHPETDTMDAGYVLYQPESSEAEHREFRGEKFRHRPSPDRMESENYSFTPRYPPKPLHGVVSDYSGANNLRRLHPGVQLMRTPSREKNPMASIKGVFQPTQFPSWVSSQSRPSLPGPIRATTPTNIVAKRAEQYERNLVAVNEKQAVNK